MLTETPKKARCKSGTSCAEEDYHMAKVLIVRYYLES